MDDLLMERAEHSAAPELLLADKIAAAFELAEGLGYKIVLSFGAPALPVEAVAAERLKTKTA